ncbi:sensor histidine kinase [Roseicella aerolata]|uniref:histidine kinase n=1 Tax=Roseicella aerolata TaxID=2883479 RepID=A0A9X1L8Q9_9PROT|nr:sensor histidine kinase [Roseicella aerolata]MCB4820178.1 sensor histidine kinase [Roseicella aerolata]
MHPEESRAPAQAVGVPVSPRAEPAHPDQDTSMPGGARLGLRTHLVLLVVLALAPALLLGAATTWQLGMAYRRAADTGLASTARALATALDRELETAMTALTTLAASPFLEGGDVEPTYHQAAAVGRAFGGWVALLDRDLRQVFNTRLPLGAELPVGAGNPFVARAIATGTPVVSDLFMGATARRPVVAVFRPLPPGTAGAAVGERRVLLLAFGPERLASLLERQDLDRAGGFAVLNDGAHRVVARSAEHGRFLGQQAPPWYAEGVRGRATGRLQGASLAGPEMTLAFSRLQHAPSWTLAVTMPLATHQAEWRGPALRFGLGAAATVGVAAGLAVLLAGRLLRPMRALAQDAERLRHGREPAASPAPEPIAEFEALRRALWRSGLALRERAVAEGRAAAAEEAAAELRDAAGRRELLVAELNHRVKNMLATVQSLAAQTLKGTNGDPGRFARHFSARLRTLARAHDLLSRDDWRPADFQTVARAALAPWLDGIAGEERVVISGEGPLAVSPQQTQALVLALHELATNATKYGALSRRGGRVELRHELDADGIATLRWTETGGPPLAGPPLRRGFGTRLLERGLAHDLGAGSSVELRFEPAGLRAALRFKASGPSVA